MARGPVSREQELKDAIEAAGVPDAGYRIFMALLRRADWRTAEIPERFQPRDLAGLAAMAGNMSVAKVKRHLNVMESLGWIVRIRRGPGRGRNTTYQLAVGRSLTPDRPPPVSDAERARSYRARKKTAQNRVTENGSESRDKTAQNRVTKGLTVRDEPAGQTPVSAERGNKEGEVVGKAAKRPEETAPQGPCPKPHCSDCGNPMDPYLASLGWTFHPNCSPELLAPGEIRPGALTGVQSTADQQSTAPLFDPFASANESLRRIA